MPGIRKRASGRNACSFVNMATRMPSAQTILRSIKRSISTTTRCHNKYKGTWTNWKRVQNPEAVKEMPTFDFASKDGKLKRTDLVYVCGFGATGSLGIETYYHPEIKNIEDLKRRQVASPVFRRLHIQLSKGKVNDIACGYGFTIVACRAEGTSHTALGFGLNNYSQIGYQARHMGHPLEIVAAPSPIYLPTEEKIIKVACGRSHSLFLDNTRKVFSMGNNSLGQCGRTIIDNEQYFGSKTIHNLCNDLPDNVSQLECGQDHSLFLTEDGKLFSCGWGADGQTGLGHYNNETRPTEVRGDLQGCKIIKVSSYADTVLALDDAGNVFGWGNTEYAQFRSLANLETEQFNSPRLLKIKNVPGKIVDVAAGGTICAILNDRGQVFVWGFGILGFGPNVDQSSRPTMIPESLFGMNIYNPESKIQQIHASLSHFAAVSIQGDLYSWGKNRGSSLGFGHSNDQLFPMRVNMNLAKVKRVALGIDHSCAIVEKVC